MDQTNYADILPDKPPAGLIDWCIKKEPKLQINALVYSLKYARDPMTLQKYKTIKCHCTACGGEYYADYVQGASCHGYGEPYGFRDELSNSHVSTRDSLMCELCGEPVTALRATSFSNTYELGWAFPWVVDVIDGNLCFISWYIHKNVDRQGEISYTARKWEAYVFTGKRCVKVMGYTRCMSACSFHDWEQRARCVDDAGTFKHVYPWNKKILEKSNLKNCKLREYMRDAGANALPVTYLRYYQKHPCVENLVIQGASRIFTDIIRTSCVFYGYYGQDHHFTLDAKGINWKAKSPSKMLGLTKQEFGMIVRDNWSLDTYRFYLKAKNADVRLTEKDVSDCLSLGIVATNIESLLFIPRTFMRTVRYLLKQKSKTKDKTLITPRYYNDYYEMSKANGADFSDDGVAFPQDLVKAHDAALAQKQERINAELAAKFADRFAVLSRFSYRSECGLEIFPASCQADLIKEGQTLHHCVGGYANSHANGETAIFFIRHIEEPATPYFTLELNEKTGSVRQNRGKCNCARTEEVKAFENEWLIFVKEILEKEKKQKHGRKRKSASVAA